MGKNDGRNGEDRARLLLAQEAARIIVEQGIRDYRVAKTKAAVRLGLNDRRSLPANAEIESAVSEHLQLFGRESHAALLRSMREAALSAMQLLHAYSPRLVGPVLHGTADGSSAVNLHLFADSSETVAMQLDEIGLPYRSYERRLKTRRHSKAGKNTPDSFAGFQFDHDDHRVEATVFPFDGIRQAPISPINGKPMRRANARAVRRLLDAD